MYSSSMSPNCVCIASSQSRLLETLGLRATPPPASTAAVKTQRDRLNRMLCMETSLTGGRMHTPIHVHGITVFKPMHNAVHRSR